MCASLSVDIFALLFNCHNFLIVDFLCVDFQFSKYASGANFVLMFGLIFISAMEFMPKFQQIVPS